MKIVAEITHDRLHRIGVGEGMNSEVFMSTDPQLGGEFALKVTQKASFGGDIARYFEEAQAMFAVAHQNVVPIQYACQSATEIMLAMPYYRNGSLGTRISAKPISTSEFIRIVIGILNGVAQIHDCGYIHFDLKPSNILFNDVRDPLVSDFGQTRRTGPGGAVLVPRMYFTAMPPETLNFGAGSALGDIYQLGLLFYRAVNGDSLYQQQFIGLDEPAIRRLIIAGKLPDRKLFLPHVPQRLRTIIRKALKVDPAERYQSVREFSKVIARVPSGLDWVTSIDPSGEITWHATRIGKADIEVRLLSAGGNWDVHVCTVNAAKRRALGATTLNRSGLKRDTALSHLTRVFGQLS